ncbi:MAG: endopeptidase La [Oligoflexales bacterium]
MRKNKNPNNVLQANDAKFLEQNQSFPLLLLPKQVFFPENIIPITSLKGLSPRDLQKAKAGALRFGVVTDLSRPKKKLKQMSGYGTEAMVTALIKLPNGEVGAMIKGLRRFLIHKAQEDKFGLVGKVSFIEDKSYELEGELPALLQAFKSLVVKFLKYQPNMSQEAAAQIFTTDEPSQLSFLVAPHLSLSIKERLNLLSCFDFQQRIKSLIQILGKEIELLNLSSRIQEKVKDGVHDNMRRNYLREQIQVIKKELGDLGAPEGDDITVLKNSLDQLKLPEKVLENANREIDRLAMMPSGSPEYMISWTFLNWIKDLPWDKQEEKTENNSIDLKKATQILDQHHYGLPRIKERVLEFIALLQHRGKVSGQILLLSGPPGVGKTSLGKSIASALERPFVRVSLGGVKDEAEIRGHRRTYIGSMPGKIIQAMKDAGSSKPVILLDEIDKAGRDGGRDLSSSLLEVLDPEQNQAFTDHYLGFPFDLSQVLFIATANSLREISAPLLDRMEVLELSGYTESEKINIANRHLLPQIREDFSLTEENFALDQTVLPLIIRYYTREAGVRQLGRSLSTIGRKVVRGIVESPERTPDNKLNSNQLVNFLGNPKYFAEPIEKKVPPGVAIGLAYTTVGGDILYIESRKNESKNSGGSLVLTGSLGKVMQESAQTVFSFLLSHADFLAIDRKEMLENKVHIHLPDGATPKDGPSAGVALLCAVASLFNSRSVRSCLAMTGEITLRGQVLPVGGIKEKLLAAHRYGRKEVIIPAANWMDLEEIPDEVLEDLKLYPVQNMLEVLVIAHLIAPASGEAIPSPKRFERNKLKNQFSFPDLPADPSWQYQ